MYHGRQVTFIEVVQLCWSVSGTEFNWQDSFQDNLAILRLQKQLVTVTQMLTKCWENNIKVHQICADIKQAYDSIDDDKLCTILCNAGIPGKLVRLIKATMKDAEAQVKVQGQLTEQLKIRQGLKQGDRLAPSLFNLVLKYVIRNYTI